MEPQTTPTTQTFDDPDTYAIIGAALEVQHTLGCGFLEKVYAFALANEFKRRAIPFVSEVELAISYKGDLLPCTYRADLICFGTVLVELKAQRELSPIDEAQLLNYLKITGLRVGLLLNFGKTRLEQRRFVMG